MTQVWLRLQEGDPAAVKQRVRQVMAERKWRQPAAVRSLGSTFKNPGRLTDWQRIDRCGLKGYTLGATQVLALTELIRQRVRQRFGVELELEIIPVGSPDIHSRSS
ncbi:MAG: hypothetical protein ACRENY_05520 [Candidatus Dormibacteria bacterium]